MMSSRYYPLAIMLLMVGHSIGMAQAPPLMDRARVNPEDSTEAVRQLRLVDAYVQQGSWTEAVDLLQTMIETYPREVIPIPKVQPVRYISVRTHCHQLLSTFPADALTPYRSRVDSQADALLTEFESSGNESLLHQLVDQYFCSTAADAAIEKIGDRELAAGHIDTAIAWWSKLLPSDPPASDPPAAEQKSTRLRYPDPKNDLARLWAKWSVAQLLRGEMVEAERSRLILKEKFADAKGELAGSKGPYWKIVEDFGRDADRRAAAIARPDWTTFAGDYARGKIAPVAANIGAVEKRWGLAAAPPSEDSDGIDANQAMMMQFQQVTPRLSPRNGIYTHPLAIGREVVVSDGNYLYWFDVDKDEPVYKFNLNVNNVNAGGAAAPLYHHTLTLAGNLLFVRTGGALPQFPAQMNMRPAGSSSLLFCFDHATKKLLWWVNAAEADTGPQSIFEGAPVVVDDNVYIGVTRLDAMSTTHVVCLEADSGKVAWKRLVCEASSDWTFPLNPDQNLLTLGEDTLYYGTNLGAVAALHLPTQKIKWISEYANAVPVGAKAVVPEVNPCVYHQGRVFFAPIGTSSLYCFDAETGETLWQNRIPAEHVLGVAKGLLIVTGNRVFGVDIKTGQVAWQFPENQPKGVGRGMLAGDYVYWPTSSEIHVLEQASGLRAAPPISLLEGLRTKPGNLIAGNGYALLAQNRTILVLRPYSWLQKKQEEYLTDHPESAEAHLLYADASSAADDIDRAFAHYTKAIELANPKEVVEGRPLLDVAHDHLVHAIIHEAHRRTAGDKKKDPQAQAEANLLLKKALDQTIRPADRWSVRREQIALAEADNNPAILTSLLNELLADEELVTAQASDNPGYRLPVRRYLRQQYEKVLLPAHATKMSLAKHVSSASPTSPPTTQQLLQSARQLPFAADRVPFLFARAQEYSNKGNFSDALLLCDEILDTPELEPARRLDTLLAVEKLYGSLELERSRSQILDELALSFGNDSVDPSTSVAQYVAAERKEIAAPPFQGHYRPAWITRDGSQHVVIPEGLPPSDRLAGVVVMDAEADGKSGIRYCRMVTGATEWRADCRGQLEHVTHSNAGLLFLDGNTIVCRAYGDGQIRWQAWLDPEGKSTTWATHTSGLRDGAKSSVSFGSKQDRPKNPVIVDASRIYVLGNDGWITSIDQFDGRILWQSHPILTIGKEVSRSPRSPLLQVMNDSIFYSTENMLVTLDRSGKVRWDYRLLDEVGGRPVVEIDGTIIAVTRRNQISALDQASGKVLWSHETSTPAWSLPHLYHEAGVLLALFDSYQLSRLNPADGKTVWEKGVTRSPTPSLGDHAMLAGGYFVFTTSAGIDCRSVETGQLIWHGDSGPIVEARIQDSRIEALIHSPRESQFVTWLISDGKKMESESIPLEGESPLEDESAKVHWTAGGVVITSETGAMGLVNNLKSAPIGQEK